MAGIGFAWDDAAWKADGHDLDCSGDGTEGCSTSAERSPGGFFGTVLIGLLWLRRRHAEATAAQND